MHVLVTGASGFVGSQLVPARLAAGHDVCALDGTRTPARPEPVTAGGVEG